MMELSKKDIFVGNMCKMLIGLMTSEKEPLKKIVTNEIVPSNLIHL